MIVISLGANLDSTAGTPAQTLVAAMQSLIRNSVKVETVSNFYATPAWPDPSDPPYVNAVIKVCTDRSPAALLDVLHTVEISYGRTRGEKNAPRTLDLDLIDYDGRAERGPPILPHPRMAARAFVLIPLADVAPDWRHPVTGRSIAELIAALPEQERAAVRPMSA
ncbi:MAG: 2-amino-4-hydroxy-6-hydroxymethyldihydropteridine diphosphokinase [Alphaproteobacteria bacterium]|nr:2-amino-4-hydroxy-6-hydroxymethyldihydropteridine diphosphokinase [Alphaproteobacteria bacterium]MDE2629420.1 2-amino-4-hydroxy-6-hydroxymethyldihydropteridine diphosphokinase [Alphaproteobacteria bacterium]